MFAEPEPELEVGDDALVGDDPVVVDEEELLEELPHAARATTAVRARGMRRFNVDLPGSVGRVAWAVREPLPGVPPPRQSLSRTLDRQDEHEANID
jgi:hypothetical protein